MDKWDDKVIQEVKYYYESKTEKQRKAGKTETGSEKIKWWAEIKCEIKDY